MVRTGPELSLAQSFHTTVVGVSRAQGHWEWELVVGPGGRMGTWGLPRDHPIKMMGVSCHVPLGLFLI